MSSFDPHHIVKNVLADWKTKNFGFDPPLYLVELTQEQREQVANFAFKYYGGAKTPHHGSSAVGIMNSFYENLSDPNFSFTLHTKLGLLEVEQDIPQEVSVSSACYEAAYHGWMVTVKWMLPRVENYFKSEVVYAAVLGRQIDVYLYLISLGIDYTRRHVDIAEHLARQGDVEFYKLLNFTIHRLSQFEFVVFNACRFNRYNMLIHLASTCPFNAYEIDWTMYRGHSTDARINDEIESWIYRRRQYLLYKAITEDNREEVKRMVSANYNLGVDRIRIFEKNDPRIQFYLSLLPEEYVKMITN